jgi:hypothetical protein
MWLQIYTTNNMTNSEAEGDDFDGVFASTKTKMFFLREEHIVVQQDGARPHTGKRNIERFNDLGQRDGWNNIEVVAQPAQSPDLFVNDLSLFFLKFEDKS